MKELAIPLEAISENEFDNTMAFKNKRQKWLRALLFSSLAGILTGLTGLIISGLSLFGIIEKHSRVNNLGTILIVFAFPLVFFSAHALDRISEIDKEKQRQ